MKSEVRDAIARIDLMQRGEVVRRGTGCLVGERLILTAFHVVADRHTLPPRLAPGTILVTFPMHSTGASVLEGKWSAAEDWVLLACDTPPSASVRPLLLASIVRDDERWETYGFPDAQPLDGMVCRGVVEDLAGVLDGVPVHQLYCHQAAAATGMPVRGLSGAPLIVEGAVCGILRWALLAEGQNVGGTIYACPAAAIAARAPEYFPPPLRQVSSVPSSHEPGEREAFLIEQLRTLESGAADQTLRDVIRALGDEISEGSVGRGAPTAAVRSIRRLLRDLDVPPATAAVLLQCRLLLGSALWLDANHHHLGAVITEKARDFVGRNYVFDAIEGFLESAPCGYFIIEGDPGLGKSAVVAEYARRTGCIVHFNVRSLGINTSAQFIQSVCAQLIVEAGLPYSGVPRGATSDGALIVKLLTEAAQALRPDRLVIAVDALDEVDLSGQSPGANILLLPATLPNGVYIIMTRRHVEVPLVALSPQRVLDMSAYGAENREDLEASLASAVKRPELSAWIAAGGLTVVDFISRLADLSDNNFMYLRYVLPEIEGGAYATLSIDRLPAGLGGYYDDHWRRMGMTTNPLPRANIRILYVLCEVRQPVTRRLVSHFASDASMHVDELTVQEMLGTWRQFLTEDSDAQPPTYSIYHASFRDFLRRKDIVQAAGVTFREINARIADSLLDELYGPR